MAFGWKLHGGGQTLAPERLLDAVADATPFDVLLLDEMTPARLHQLSGAGHPTAAEKLLAETPRIVLTRRGALATPVPDVPLTVVLSRPVRQRQLFAAVARANETGSEAGCRTVIEIAWRPDLTDFALLHHDDEIRVANRR